MGTQPWDEGPTWTDVARLRAAQPSVWAAAHARVATNSPVDPDAAATEFLEAAIVRAQNSLIGTILKRVDGPGKVPATIATTEGDLVLHTTQLAIVEVYRYDTGRGMPESIKALEEEVEAWLESLQEGHEFLSHPTPGEEELRRVPVRRNRTAGLSPSGLAAQARRLLL